VIVVLPLETIVRILDHTSPAPRARSRVASRRTVGRPDNEARAALAENIISALNKAKQDKANLLGPLEPTQFNDLSAWCRNVGLTKEGENVEAAVRASG
jgi:hypothetical protein